jgi:hypothetical protein
VKYDLTDEEVDRMVQSNKELHIELAMVKVELAELAKVKVELAKAQKALNADVLRFNAERAQLGTAEAIHIAMATVAVNADKLVPVLMQHFGAPTDKQARGALGLVGRVLIALEQMVRDAPVAEVRDAMTKPPPAGTTQH